MALTYLELVNAVAVRLNETELTSGNFSSAAGIYSTMKLSVNDSINKLNRVNFLWPFNWSTRTDTLTAGTTRYSWQSTTKFIDFNSFRIQRDVTFNNKTQPLIEMDYEEYLSNHIDDEYNTTATGIRKLPTHVARAAGREYVVWPSPDEAYSLDYEEYAKPVELSAHDDTTTVPDEHKDVIIDGSMRYMHVFQKDLEAARDARNDFEIGIAEMRKLLSNRFEYMRDTRTLHNSYPKTTERLVS